MLPSNEYAKSKHKSKIKRKNALSVSEDASETLFRYYCVAIANPYKWLNSSKQNSLTSNAYVVYIEANGYYLRELNIKAKHTSELN